VAAEHVGRVLQPSQLWDEFIHEWAYLPFVQSETRGL
jgi:hypothetical protein